MDATQPNVNQSIDVTVAVDPVGVYGRPSWALQQRPVLTDYVLLGVVLVGRFKRLQLARFDYQIG